MDYDSDDDCDGDVAYDVDGPQHHQMLMMMMGGTSKRMLAWTLPVAGETLQRELAIC